MDRIARIERGDRLVGQQHRRLLHQGPRDRDPLLLAARQGAGALEGMRDEIEPLQRFDRHRALGIAESS